VPAGTLITGSFPPASTRAGVRPTPCELRHHRAERPALTGGELARCGHDAIVKIERRAHDVICVSPSLVGLGQKFFAAMSIRGPLVRGGSIRSPIGDDNNPSGGCRVCFVTHRSYVPDRS
jgi:hypothetical protein